VRQFDVAPRDRLTVLADHVEQDEEIARTAIENPIERAADVARPFIASICLVRIGLVFEPSESRNSRTGSRPFASL
jgi:hypothetical protein